MSTGTETGEGATRGMRGSTSVYIWQVFNCSGFASESCHGKRFSSGSGGRPTDSRLRARRGCLCRFDVELHTHHPPGGRKTKDMMVEVGTEQRGSFREEKAV
jgi:hypothetical protein